MSLASMDVNAQIAIGFLVAVLVITGGLFAFILTRKNSGR